MIRLALVEDDELYRSQLREYIDKYSAVSGEKFTVTEFSDGDEIALGYKAVYDIILMDIMMPVMDGMEATREIRTMNRRDASAVVIIAMTANAFTEDKTKALKSGMDDYLTKPLESEKLIRALSRYKHN